MPRFVLTLSLLCLLTLPLAAHADQIDDFVLTIPASEYGNASVLAFSLPASTTIFRDLRGGAAFSTVTYGTVNGMVQTETDTPYRFYVLTSFPDPAFAFNYPQQFSVQYGYELYGAVYFGPYLVTSSGIDPSPVPDPNDPNVTTTSTYTYIPGTYTLAEGYDLDPIFADGVITGPDITLTITPESTATPIPNPPPSSS